MEPTSGLEPLTCRLRSREPRAGLVKIQTHTPYHAG